MEGTEHGHIWGRVQASAGSTLICKEWSQAEHGLPASVWKYRASKFPLWCENIEPPSIFVYWPNQFKTLWLWVVEIKAREILYNLMGQQSKGTKDNDGSK